MQRYFLSFRVSTQVGQIIPTDALNKIKEFYKYLKEKRIFNAYSLNQICNIDETPIFLNMVSKKTIHFKGKKTITIKTTNQEKVRVSLLLTITAEGGKLPPLFIFKSKKGGTIEKHLNKYNEVLNHNAFILCNENT